MYFPEGDVLVLPHSASENAVPLARGLRCWQAARPGRRMNASKESLKEIGVLGPFWAAVPEDTPNPYTLTLQRDSGRFEEA